MLEFFGLGETKSQAVKVGDKYGRMRVVAVGEKPGYKYYAVCKCECDSPLKIARFDSLKNGSIQSCGCFHREVISKYPKDLRAHYSRWRAMISRCENPDDASYKNYGGRGIKVFARWSDFEAFANDLPPNHFLGAEMDRIDNDGNYEPGNIRWATRQQNSNNRRSGRYFDIGGERLSLIDLSRRHGLPESVIRDRLDRWGWSLDDALNTPVRTAKLITANGKTLTIDEWAEEVGLQAGSIRQRLREGWNEQDAVTIKAGEFERRYSRTYEYNGGEYTINQLAGIRGISTKLMSKRIQERGWAVDKAMSQ